MYGHDIYPCKKGDVWIFDEDIGLPILVSEEDLEHYQKINHSTIVTYPTEDECWEACKPD